MEKLSSFIGRQLPKNFKKFDFYDPETGLAVNTKTMDTLTDVKLANPKAVYRTMKSYIDSVVRFKEYSLSGVFLSSSNISSKAIELAIPNATTASQWQQLQKAIKYGSEKGVSVNVTVIK